MKKWATRIKKTIEVQHWKPSPCKVDVTTVKNATRRAQGPSTKVRRVISSGGTGRQDSSDLPCQFAQALSQGRN